MKHNTDPSHPAFYARILRKWWYVPIIFAVISAAVSYEATKKFIKKEYGAHVTLQVRAHGAGQDAGIYATLMTTGPVLTAAYNSLPPNIQKQSKASFNALSCSPDAITNRFITCNTTSHNPTRAPIILNDFATSFVSGLAKAQKSQLVPALRLVQSQEQQQQAALAGLQSQIVAKAAAEQLANGQVAQNRRGLAAATKGTKDLFAQYQIKSLETQLAQNKASLNQLSYQQGIASGHVLDIIKAQEAKLAPLVASEQTQLQQKFAAVQQQVAAQNSAAAQKVASQSAQVQQRVAQQNIAKSRAVQVHYQLSFLQVQASEARSTLNHLKVQAASLQRGLFSRAPVTVIDPATPNRNPVSPNTSLNVLLGIILGLAIAVALIILLEYRDKSFRTLAEVGVITGLPVLGVVPRFRGSVTDLFLVSFHRPRSALAEAYRLIRTSIEGTAHQTTRILLVTSTEADEGKSTSAANLAASIALAGHRVLLIDADLRRAGLSQRFGLTDRAGLGTGLTPSSTGISPVRTDIPTLHFVPAGPSPTNPAELLDSQYMSQWLQDQRSRYDTIVIDGPPILGLADGRILAGLADAVILVIDPNRASRPAVRQVCDVLDKIRVRTLGAIVNRSKWPGDLDFSRRSPYDERTHAHAARAATGQ